MTASAAIGSYASAAVDMNLAAFHLLIQAGQDDEFCRWFRQGRYASIAKAWLACARPEWMLDLLDACRHNDAAKLRRFAVRAVRDMPIGGGRAADVVMDNSVRDALEIGEHYAAGAATDEELRAAHDLADAVWRRHHGRRSAKRLIASAACSALAGPDLFDARVVASMAAKIALGEPDAKRFQADLLREIFGNPWNR
jgi:hypothetical protein